MQASDGSFYGTTNLGGAKSEGTIFKMDSSGNLTTLYSFTGGADGAQPSGGLIQASDGYLYGATLAGGASSAGVVFRTDTSGNMTTLYSFSGGTDGYGPEGSLIQATDGYFYGVTQNGGNLTCEILPTSGCGTIFRIDSTGNLTTLYSFTGGADGRIRPWPCSRDAMASFMGQLSMEGIPIALCPPIPAAGAFSR